MTPLAERLAIKKLYWWSFIVRFVLGSIAWLFSKVFGLPLIEDAGNYSKYAAELAQNWLNGTMPASFMESIQSGRDAWFIVAVLACFYLFTAGYEAVPLAIFAQCLLTSLTPVYAYRAARRLGIAQDGALFTGRLLAFSPAFVFWAGALYKEGLILFLTFILIDHVLQLQQKFRPISTFIVGICLFALFGLRFYIAAILSVTIIMSLIVGRQSKQQKNPLASIVRQIILIAILLAVFALFGLGDRVFNVLGGDIEKSLADINTSRKDLATASSGYQRDIDILTVSDAIAYMPIGLIYFLFVPFPWHIGNFRQNFTILEVLIWAIIIYPLCIRGMVRGIRINFSGSFFLALSTIAITCFYALFMGNIGTAYRLRVLVWAIIALFAGWGWSIRNARRKKIRERAKKLVDKSIRPADLSLAPSPAPRLSLPGPGVGPA